MRSLSLLLIGAVVASCSSAPPPPNPQAQAEFARLTAGRVAGPPVECIPTLRSADDMRVIDENTVVFREGGDRVYVNEIPGGCPGLGFGHNALVFPQASLQRLCRGEFARVIDASTGVMAGSCTLGSFVPYVTPR